MPRGTDLLRDLLDCVRVIQDRLQAAQSRQRSYADRRRRPLSFIVGDKSHVNSSPLAATQRGAKSHVREACKGMRNIFLKNKMVMVPIKEMSDVFTVKKREREFLNGSWVRLKRGTYKGDLAQIVNGDDIRRRVTVKLIPRIDFRALVNQFDGIKIPKEEKFCPPARFWSATKAKALGIPVTRQKDSVTGDYFDTVNGMKFLKFKDGLLYKSVSIRSIGYKVHPTLDDLEKDYLFPHCP
ncbi:putative transcription elongation factor SPT5 -like protein 2 [Capsicum chinense]|nr:putative transcription elongation factor SPT5 -like protein 2 [Capsicum chinense]